MNPINEGLSLSNVWTDKKQLTLAPLANSLPSELVLMDCGDFSIFVPASEVISLVSAQQLVAQAQSLFDCGYVEFEQQYYSVFCFNKSLQLQTSVKSEDSTIVLFNEQNMLFGICCRELKKHNTTTLTLYSVPPSMRSRKQPFVEFTVIDHCAVGLSSAAELASLLRLRGAKLVLQQGTPTVLQGAG